MILEVLEGLKAGTITPVAQNEEEATYLKQITKEAGIIDFSSSAAAIERQVRACIPWPSAFTALEGKTFKIWDADVLDDTEFSRVGGCACAAGCEPGTVVYSDKHRIIIKTGDGFLQPNEVQIEGKKRMTMDEFLRGRKIVAGTVFGQ
ncbi:MAG: hypothetical protein HUJ76_12000 [Parasporobacterium sp.]|nr:hypothetical protein [Parasporobacterium sp.]